MENTRQKNWLNRRSCKENDFSTKPVAREKNHFFSPAAISAYLYGKYESVPVETRKLGKTGFFFPEQPADSLTGNSSPNEQCTERWSLHDVNCEPREGNPFHLSRAVRTLPPEVYLCKSSVPGDGHGVCTRKQIPSGTWIGPFEGKRVLPHELKPGADGSNMWEIYENGKLSHFIDGSDVNASSWIRFIQCARSKEEQNLFAFQYQGNIYYRSFRDISVGEELLVWYNDGYTQFLGIPLGLQDATCLISNSGARSTPVRSSPPSLTNHRTVSQDSTVMVQRSSHSSEHNHEISPTKNNLQPSPKSPVEMEESELTTWRCQQCHETFSQRLALQIHVCPRRPAKPFQCGQCNEGFSNSSLLRAHVITHSSEKPFKCGFCSRAFVGATTLNNHIRTHTGQKPFACETCGKTFVLAAQLARHTSNPRECTHGNLAARGVNRQTPSLA